MLRIRNGAVSLVAATALTLAFGAAGAVAHDRGHGFGHARHHRISGVVQSTDTTANTVTITLGGSPDRAHRDWSGPGTTTPPTGSGSGTSTAPATRTVTLSVAGATILSAPAMHADWDSPGATPTTPSTITLADVHPGDFVSARVAGGGHVVRQDAASGTPVPVSTLIDFGAPSSSSGSGSSGSTSGSSTSGSTSGSGTSHHHRHSGTRVRRLHRS